MPHLKKIKYRKWHKRAPGNMKMRGMSLIEVVVYVGILGIIMVFVTNTLITIVSTYRRVGAEREALSSARLTMETITKHIAYAQEVYAPTSRFNTNNGQISLITPFETTPEHTTIYADFWSDGNSIVMQKEGQAAITLSSPRVRVTQFRVERIVQTLGREAIKITLSVSSPVYGTAPMILTTTTALRGGY